MSIELPNYNWFVNGQGSSYALNRYSGSCGTSPTTGALSVTTFNYRVSAEKNDNAENGFLLIAECFLILPWSKGGGKAHFTRAEFEASPNGLETAAAWLSEQSLKYKVGI